MALSFVAIKWQVFFLALLPVFELRAAIPWGIAMGENAAVCFIYAVAGNFLPVIPLLLFLPLFCGRLYKYRRFANFMDSYTSKLKLKGEKAVKYGAIGLTLFVAVPLPMTGVWSGCVLAYLLGINIFRAALAVLGGEIIAALLVLSASVGLKTLAGKINGIIVFAALLLILIMLFYFFKRKKCF